MHLLIPFAACLPEACQHTWATLKLPHLTQLLAHLTPLVAPTPFATGDENSLSPPHERALATACGWLGTGGLESAGALDGLLPWGAYYARARGGFQELPGVRASHTSPGLNAHTATPPPAWAVITPVNWSVQTAHITMTDPAALALDETESKTLLAAMQPYFAQDGIALYDDTPGRWLACGDVFRGLPSASPDRAIGRNVQDWQPPLSAATAAQAKLLRRLQSEMQMLLYTHPLTDQRSARGLPAVNSFWVSGTGVLPSGLEAPAVGTDLVVADALRAPALREDWAAWGHAWQAIDADHGAALLAAVQANQRAGRYASPDGETGDRLTLCGERRALTWVNRPQSAWRRLHQNIFGKKSALLMNNMHSML